MNWKWAVAAAMAFGLAQPAVADVLYDNGPVGTVGPQDLEEGGKANSFTLTDASTVTGVRFNIWTGSGDVLQTIDWAITTAAKTFPDDGTASVSQTFLFTSGDGKDVDREEFSIAPQVLGPGTYWLVLQNPVDTGVFRVGWDQSDGPSTAYDHLGGPVGSESFQIIGTVNAPGVPEPAAWALMLTGFGGLGAMLRRRRREAAA
jgi:hypothetical protein